MSIVSWILFGLIVGIIANAIDPEEEKGNIVTTVGLGIVGALVGGFVANLIFGTSITGFNLTSFVIAVVGSLGLLLAGKNMHKA